MKQARMMSVLMVASVVGALLFAGGCGGGGGGLVHPFAGTYSASYTRGSVTGSLTIGVASDGRAEVVVRDSQEGVFVGSGNVTNEGQLTATAAKRQANSLTVSAQFTKQNGTVSVSGSITGAFSVPSWSATKVAEAGINAFAGNWSGTYSGDEEGTWTATFGTDGKVTATAQSPSVGTVNLTGTVSLAGVGTLRGSGTGVGGPFTITWEGIFYLQDSEAFGSGSWSSSSGFEGTWNGSRSTGGGGGGGGGGGIPSGTYLIAKIDGYQFRNETYPGPSFTEILNTLTIVAWSADEKWNISFYVPRPTSVPATYDLSSHENGYAVVTYVKDINNWIVDEYMSIDGTITINVLTDTNCQGTFSFKAKDKKSGNVINVTEGKFNVPKGPILP